MASAIWACGVLLTRVGAMSAEEALLALAEREGLSFVAADLPADAVYEGEIGEFYATLDEIGAQCGLETSVWKNILLARPDPGGTLRERISRALTDHERELLLRPSDSGDEFEPGWNEYVVECAYHMLIGDTSQEAYDLAYDTALWMAAQDLEIIFRIDEALADGRVILRLAQHLHPSRTNPASQPGPGLDLILCVPRLGPEDDLFILDGVSWEGESPTPGTPPAEAAGATDLELDASLADAATALGGAVSDRAGAPQRLVALRLRSVAPDEALRALGLVTGLVVVREGDGAELDLPEALSERFAASLPLDLRAQSEMTADERGVLRRARETEMWRTLSPDDRALLLERATRLRDVSPLLRRQLHRAPSFRLGLYCAAEVQCFPGRDGTVPLWLFEDMRTPSPAFVLFTPMRTDQVLGLPYLRLFERAGLPSPEWKVQEGSDQ